MSITRKIKRKKAKENKKTAKKVMRKVGDTIASMPKVCRKCNTELDKSNDASLDEWKIKIFESGRVDLTCGDCSEVDKNTLQGSK